MIIEGKIFVAGGSGLVGSAIIRALRKKGASNIYAPTHSELNLMDGEKVLSFLKKEKFDYVIDAAAKVGGINANKLCPSEFFYENNQMSVNLIWGSFVAEIPNFLYLGSACMYPKECNQPIKEKELTSGYFEQTNEGYALAKLGGVRLCQYLSSQYGCHYVSAIPANTFGEGDNFDENNSHVIPALIRKFIKAKEQNLSEVTLWGTGKPKREFLYVDDLASGLLFALDNYCGLGPFNVAGEREISMLELANLVRDIVDVKCSIFWDATKPDGMYRRKLDDSILSKLGWQHEIPLELGIKKTVDWYMKNGR